MKKRIIASGAAAVLMFSSVAAGAKVLYPDSVQRRIEIGYKTQTPRAKTMHTARLNMYTITAAV